jgi:group I intron endonuclease
LKENKGKAGVYRWTNKVNGKTYIGSSVDLGQRFSGYFSQAYLQRQLSRSESRIYRALIKYGYSNFKLEILEHCKPEQCRAKEQHYLDSLPHIYNISPTAGSSLGCHHSDRTKAKMGEAHKKAWLARDPAARGASLANLAKGRAARSKGVLVTNIETGKTVSYVSQSQAAYRARRS